MVQMKVLKKRINQQSQAERSNKDVKKESTVPILYSSKRETSINYEKGAQFCNSKIDDNVVLHSGYLVR